MTADDGDAAAPRYYGCGGALTAFPVEGKVGIYERALSCDCESADPLYRRERGVPLDDPRFDGRAWRRGTIASSEAKP